MGEGTFPLGMADRAMRLTEREQDAAAGQVRVRSVRHRENCDLTRQVFSCCPPFFSCREIGISGREMAVCRPESTHRTGQQSTAQQSTAQYSRAEKVRHSPKGTADLISGFWMLRSDRVDVDHFAVFDLDIALKAAQQRGNRIHRGQAGHFLYKGNLGEVMDFENSMKGFCESLEKFNIDFPTLSDEQVKEVRDILCDHKIAKTVKKKNIITITKVKSKTAKAWIGLFCGCSVPVKVLFQDIDEEIVTDPEKISFDNPLSVFS